MTRTDDFFAHSWSGAGEEAIPMLHFNGDSVDSIGIRDPSRSGTHLVDGLRVFYSCFFFVLPIRWINLNGTF